MTQKERAQGSTECSADERHRPSPKACLVEPVGRDADLGRFPPGQLTVPLLPVARQRPDRRLEGVDQLPDAVAHQPDRVLARGRTQPAWNR